MKYKIGDKVKLLAKDEFLWTAEVDLNTLVGEVIELMNSPNCVRLKVNYAHDGNPFYPYPASDCPVNHWWFYTKNLEKIEEDKSNES